MTSFSWEPLYGSPIVAVLAAAAIVAVIAMVTPPTQDPRKRRWLVMLRSFAALVLLVAAMRPAIVRTDNRPAPATLVIAADLSRSMTLPDGDNTDRWASQTKAVETLIAGVENLAESLDVSLLGYSDETTSIGEATQPEQITSLAKEFAKLTPSGNATDLSVALQGSIDTAAGRPLAGVVLIGDGMQTLAVNKSTGTTSNVANENLASTARRVTEVLNSLGVPLWTVPTGPPKTDDSARDVGVTNLADSLQLFAGNQFDVSFVVESQGYAGTRIPVTVSWVSKDGTKKEAKSRQIDSRGARESVSMTIPMQAPPPGLYRLLVEIPTQSGEWVASNNSQTAFVEVMDGGGRVLFLSGPGRPEQTAVRRSLSRFPDLELDSGSIRSGASWPVPLDAALQPGRYDIFVIGDLDSAAIGDEQLQQLADRVSGGAGLVTLGGFQTYGTGGYADGPLAQVLPVRMNRGLRRQPIRGVLSEAERNARAGGQLAGPIEIQLVRNHPVVDLGGNDPGSVWKTLPKMPGANRFVGAKATAGTQILLKTAKDQPILIVGGYGKGRVASLAIDETHRWRRAGQADAHRRFWRQLMLWLMSREETSGDRVIAELDVRRFETDRMPEFSARLQTLGDSRDGVKLTAKLLDESDQETLLDVSASERGSISISGNLPELDAGFYRLLVEASDPNVEADEVAFQVTETSRELARPMADPVYLQQLADMTSAHGGASFSPTNIGSLIDVIAQKRRTAETPVVEKNRLGDGPKSGWLVFLLFTGALSIEWFLRRKWSMA